MPDVMRSTYRELTDAEKEVAARIKGLGNELHNAFGEAGVSREISLAKTKLEEAVMWAIKHVTGPKGVGEQKG